MNTFLKAIGDAILLGAILFAVLAVWAALAQGGGL